MLAHHRKNAKAVQVVDTLQAAEPRAPLTDHTLLQIATLYKPPGTALTIELASVQQQNGVHDCGVFAIAFMAELCLGKGNPSAAAAVFDQSRIRAHLVSCLRKGTFSTFPKLTGISSRKKIRLGKTSTLSEELHCICRMPDIYADRMIECDTCAKWFHITCVHIAKNARKSQWICPSCSQVPGT